MEVVNESCKGHRLSNDLIRVHSTISFNVGCIVRVADDMSGRRSALKRKAT